MPSCTVKRDGQIVTLKAHDLVPGDLVLLSAGQRIPADIRLLHVVDCSTQEALLTGESNPIKKEVKNFESEC